MRPIDADEISKQAAELSRAYLRIYRKTEDTVWESRSDAVDHVVEMINDAPTIEAEPVKHGEWIFQGHRDSEGRNIYCCSNCDFYKYVFPYNVASWRAREKHCPSCGAKMDGKELSE